MDKLLSYTPEPFFELDREAEGFEFDPLTAEWKAEEEDEEEVGKRRRPRFSRKAPRRNVKKSLSLRNTQPRLSVSHAKPLVRLPKLALRPSPLPAIRPLPIPFVPPLLVPRTDLSPTAPKDVPRADDDGDKNQAGPDASGTPPAAEPSSEPASEHIRWVQDCLNRTLGLNLPLDGVMGRETRSAVRMFQERRGLTMNGLIGPEMEEALRTACAPSSVPAPAHGAAPTVPNEFEMMKTTSCASPLYDRRRDMNYELNFRPESFGGSTEYQEFDTLELEALDPWQGEIGQSGQQRVRWIQESLNKILGFQLKVDGIMGPKTRSAVRAFQASRGLAADGIVGPRTEAAIFRAGGSRPPQPSTGNHPVKAGDTTTGLIHVYQATDQLQDVLLYDFDINGASLKSAHRSTLDALVKFMAEDARSRSRSGKKWTVSLDGYASRTGDPEWNRELSRQRMYSCNDYLQAHCNDWNFELCPRHISFNTNWHGFDQTTVRGENPWGRSVRVAVHRPNVPPPPPVPPMPPVRTCRKSKDWQIRILGAFGAGVPLPLPGGPVLAGDVALFEINDLTNRRVGYFYFLGAGVAVGLKLPLPKITPTGGGPYTCFKTEKAVCLENFKGRASFGQPPAVGPWSLGPSMLKFEGPIVGRVSWGQVGTIPKYIPIQTGPTILNVFSSTRGRFELGSIHSVASLSGHCVP